MESFLNGRVVLHAGDSRDVLKSTADNSIDACVCDPPYALQSIVKRFGGKNAAPAKGNEAYMRASAGFMGKKWDTGETAFDPSFWAEVLRVLKPGGHLVAFSGTRTYHRMACAIEDAGFEVRDMLSWLYGSGFPKSHDVSKGIDRAGAEREVVGTRISEGGRSGSKNSVGGHLTDAGKLIEVTSAATAPAIEWQGWGTALKPAQEKICFAQKPNVFAVDYDTIGSQIADLESSLWSMLPAKTAERNFGLSQSEFDAVCASARWNADERNSTRAALSEAMGTARFVLAITSSLNTVSSWKRTWAEGSRPANTSITEMELSTTTDLRTLKSYLSRITPASIMQAHRSGLWLIANASTAERVFDATLRRLSGILEHSVLANAIAREVDNCRDVGAKVGDAPILLGRKPLVGTVAANVLQHGTGAINIDGCRIETDDEAKPRVNQKQDEYFSGKKPVTQIPFQNGGRWPANIIHDGSEEVIAVFPDADGGRPVADSVPSKPHANGIYGERGRVGFAGYEDSGSAARFFYTAKADADDRLGSKHPTVKPVDLMQWLCRLVTPPGGTVLDPFAGTGTTGEAAFREGFNAILIEREEEYQTDIRRRMGLVLSGPDERSRESIKARTAGQPIDAGPLFGGLDTPPPRRAGEFTESTQTNNRTHRIEMVSK